MMQVIEKNIGPKIPYEESGTRVYFGDDELMVNVGKYQRDWPVLLDICSNRDNQLVIGTGEGLYYVAQLEIPLTEYTEPDALSGKEMGTETPPVPLPINMSDVILTLWSIETPTPTNV